ncbi:MAG TPA: tetratricopeptide repeat protein [Anaerolineales bacterium]
MPEEAVDTLFEEAVDALRHGDRARGKEILTRLLKADQNNPNYWIWMSASVDTAKERIYCLETALKLDPGNATAKRGLVLLGGLAPDEGIQPFPLNRPRPWEEDLLLAHERPQERGARSTVGSSLARIVGVVLAGLAVIALAAAAFYFSPRIGHFIRPIPTSTVGPSPTFTLTPTFVNTTLPGITTQIGPTPLADLLGVHYTPTPLYINTPRVPLSADIYGSAQSALKQGNWDLYIQQMQEIQKVEPNAADVPYYIGEAYRLKGDCRTAMNYYNQALQISDKFAPGYAGLARARLCIDPGADTSQLYQLAIQADPNYGEAYLDRASFDLLHRDSASAVSDLRQAEKLMPNSALVQLGFAEAYLLAGNNAGALQAAEKANSIDQTLLPSYFYLGYAYVLNEQYADAIKPLQIYLVYQTKDATAYGLLGQALTETGDYPQAVTALNAALENDPTQVRSYIYLGKASLRTGDLVSASGYFKRALEYFPDSFDANIGLTEVMYDNRTFGSAYLQAETSKSKATNDTQLALAIYWRALSQEGRKSFADAIADWKTLLAMPASVMTADMRQTAQTHLSGLLTATPNPNAATPTLTPKPSGSGTPTGTPTPSPGPTATP